MSAAASARGRRARTLALTSGKGGVGKTLLAANLAAVLAGRGERVLLLDADLGLANLDVLLGLQPRKTLHDVFSGTAALEEAIVAAPGGFSALLAGSGLIEYSRLTPEVRARLKDAIDRLAPRFDRILVDTGAGISDVVLHAVSLADEVLMVATPEPTAMTDAYATLKLLVAQQRRRAFHVVVNQVERAGEGRAVCAQLQRVVDRFVTPTLAAAEGPVRLDLLGEVPSDAVVREAVHKRALLVETWPGSAASRAVEAIGARLAG